MEDKTTGNIYIEVPEWKKSSLDSKVVMYTIKVSKKGADDWILDYRYS